MQSRESFLIAVSPVGREARDIRLSKSEYSLGTEESNDLVLRDSSVSRRHALLRRRRGRWQIIDRGSTNGTYAGSRRADSWVTLGDGEEVRFGGARFVFRSGSAPKARATGGMSLRKRTSRLRALMVLVIAGFVISFAATQYLLFRSYQRRVASLRSIPSAQPTPEAPRSETQSESASRLPPTTTTTRLWLDRVNFWRALAGLTTVSNDQNLSAAAENHSRYLVKHGLEGKLKELDAGGAHNEDPSDPWYTTSGLGAAKNADVDPPCRGCPSLSASQEIDGFIAIPFHRLAILDPDLENVGYGSHTEGGLAAAVLYLPPSFVSPTTFRTPIEFPPNGASVELASYESEWPDPLSSCAGYASPAGLPITLELGRWLVAKVSDYSVKAAGQTLKSCAFGGSTYRNPSEAAEALGRNILKRYGAVVLIPRQPLKSGQLYAISISANGKTYEWSFNVK